MARLYPKPNSDYEVMHHARVGVRYGGVFPCRRADALGLEDGTIVFRDSYNEGKLRA